MQTQTKPNPDANGRAAALHLPSSYRADVRRLAAMSAADITAACRVLATAEKAGVCLWIHSRDAGHEWLLPPLLRRCDTMNAAAHDLANIWRNCRAATEPTLF